MQQEFSPSENLSQEQSLAIAERIRQAMDKANLRQSDVSRGTELSAGYVSELLRGKKPFSRRLCRLFARVLQANARWLETGQGHPDDVDTPAAPGVSRGHADSGALSIDQVGKLLAAAERERLTPDQRALLAEYDALPASQRDLFWRLLRSALAEPTAPHPEALNENTTAERGRGKG